MGRRDAYVSAHSIPGLHIAEIIGLFTMRQTAPLWHTVSAGERRRPSALAHQTSVTIQHESLPWANKATAHEIKIRRVAYFYSAAERRSRGELWSSFAPALIVTARHLVNARPYRRYTR